MGTLQTVLGENIFLKWLDKILVAICIEIQIQMPLKDHENPLYIVELQF